MEYPPEDHFGYGLRISGLGGVVELPTSGEAASTAVHLAQTTERPPEPDPLDAEGGILALADGRHLALARRQGTATFYGPPIAPDQLAHPYLGPVATVFGRWAGREAFHAGAAAVDGQAWCVLGPRTAGKSTLMAALAARGLPVVSDDILVTDGTVAFTGPRCIDLRHPPRDLGPGCGLAAMEPRPARDGTRWRLALPPLAGRIPLGGWLFLGWGPSLTLVPVGGVELLARLAQRRAWQTLVSDPAVVLALASLPAYDLVRPADWSVLDATCALIASMSTSQSPDVPDRVAGSAA